MSFFSCDCPVPCDCREQEWTGPICFHCSEPYDGNAEIACGLETYCSTACASECACMCGREEETPFSWQIMERCALGMGSHGVKYQANDSVRETVRRIA